MLRLPCRMAGDSFALDLGPLDMDIDGGVAGVLRSCRKCKIVEGTKNVFEGADHPATVELIGDEETCGCRACRAEHICTKGYVQRWEAAFHLESSQIVNLHQSRFAKPANIYTLSNSLLYMW